MATTAKAWGVTSADSSVVPLTIERRELRPEDVTIKISHCGIRFVIDMATLEPSA